MGEFVTLTVEEGVGLIRLDRAPVNALNAQVVQELTEVGFEAGTNEDVKSVVIWGGESVFAAGADINEFQEADAGGILRNGQYLQGAFSALANLPKVCIAAINGYALGGGCELAMTADFRFAAEDAQLGQPEILLGIIPGAGGTQRLPRLVGTSKAKELIYTGKIVSAQESLEIGLVDRVFPAGDVFEKAMSAAKRYAEGPLVALEAAKLSIDRGMQGDIDSGLAIERAAFATLFATEDRKIGVKSFLDKGPGKAEFVGK